MKIVSETLFLKKGDYYESKEFLKIMSEVNMAIQSVTWNSKTKFIINPTRKGNGVNPIKGKFVKYLQGEGWETEQLMSMAEEVGPGPIDAVKRTKEGIFAVEWETGNISSSHRALNKIALGLIQKKILGGILILPVRELANHLTDRIGNLEEIRPYFSMYRKLKISIGFMGVIGVTYDSTSGTAPLIPKGKDGNSAKRKKING